MRAERLMRLELPPGRVIREIGRLRLLAAGPSERWLGTLGSQTSWIRRRHSGRSRLARGWLLLDGRVVARHFNRSVQVAGHEGRLGRRWRFRLRIGGGKTGTNATWMIRRRMAVDRRRRATALRTMTRIWYPLWPPMTSAGCGAS